MAEKKKTTAKEPVKKVEKVGIKSEKPAGKVEKVGEKKLLEKEEKIGEVKPLKKEEKAKLLEKERKKVGEKKVVKKVKGKKHEWVEYSPKQVEELVLQLTSAGYSRSEIGMILRDQYGIPSVRDLTGKKIGRLLKEKNIEEEIPENLLNLIKKSVRVKKHLDANKTDFTAKRGYQLTVSKIEHLVKYYKARGMLPRDWYFSDDIAKLLAK